MRNSSITRLVIRTAVAVGMSVIVVSAIGCAVAQPPVGGDRGQRAESSHESISAFGS